MNYAQIRRHDIANGPGIRATLFVSGCTHNCPGCFNKEQQSFNYGKLWEIETHNDFIDKALDKQVVGVSILGGEPMQQVHDPAFMHLIMSLHNKVKKPIWLWTGYTFEEILESPRRKMVLKYIDVLVDGRYEETKKDYTLMYRGSSNQRVIDVQESLKQGKVVEIEV